MKKFVFLLISLFCLHLFTNASKNNSNYLLIQTKIKSAKVLINGSQTGHTNEKGCFVIPIEKGKYQIEIKSFIYKTLKKEISVRDLSQKLVFNPKKKFIFTSTFFFLILALLISGFFFRNYYIKRSPKFFGQYKLKEEIGKGGVATIYKAFDRKTKKELALKIMDKNYIEDKDLVEKFLREGKVLSIIKKKYPDSQVVKVFDYGRIPRKGNFPFIAMEYLKGKTLLDIIKKNEIRSEQKILRIIIDIAYALKDCHNSGIYHRDLSPDNIFILDKTGEIILIDFGIAKNEFTSYRTLDGSVSGKPIYMAPEQCKGEKISSATDIYTLGILLFLLIEGNPPFIGGNPLEIMNKHQHAEVPKITQEVNPQIEVLINKMMHKEAGLRPTLDEVIDVVSSIYNLCFKKNRSLLKNG
ncbi:MAG: protein kinase [Candidatus Peribacteraceae bacterium]|nr:protein kinase [Candidatus Peribacteraceae bacterium]